MVLISRLLYRQTNTSIYVTARIFYLKIVFSFVTLISMSCIHSVGGMDLCLIDTYVNDLQIPEGQYFLGNTGIGTSDALFVPYQNAYCHLKEWQQANVK